MSIGATAARAERPGTGIALMLCAFLCFTGIDSCAKYLVQTLPAFEVTFFRYFGHLMIVSAFFLPRQGTGLLRANRLRTQIIRACVLLCGTVFNFAALQYLPLAVTSAIFFLSPLMICALSVPFLGERVGPRRWAAILIGFAGVLIIVRPGLAGVHWAWLLSLASSFCAAVYMMLTRTLAGSDSAETSQFYASLIPVIAIFPVALAIWVWPHSPTELTLMVLIGCFGWAGHQCATVAHRFAPASTLAPFVYTQILWMTASGYLFFDTIPDLWVFVGAGIVVASGLYVWLRERQLGKDPSVVNPPPK